MNNFPFGKYKTVVFLFLLTAAALVVHGYHPYVEDAEIYLPGVEHRLNPNLFPVGQEFFQSHAGMTLFPNLVAGFMRFTHLPFETGLFLLHVGSLFLLLWACWELASVVFPTAGARWSAVCLIAALLTIPVSGTALYIMDQYLNPRNLAAFSGVFGVAYTLKKKYVQAGLWIVFAACVHPLMWVFPFTFCVLWIVIERLEFGLERVFSRRAVAEVPVSLALIGIPIAEQGVAEYHEAAKVHAYHYIQHWTWYEWLGVVAPLILLLYFAQIARKRNWVMLSRVSWAFAIYGAIYLVGALAVDLPARLERFARIQPLRSLHLEYVFLFLCIGGVLGEYVLKERSWRWLVLFVPLCIGMYLAQRALFPQSAHIEWPGVAPRNPWARAFLWVRANTPVDAVFALDPGYMNIRGEDEIGFRCMAQRSRLADAVKDNGVVSMFPGLAEEWWTQVRAQSPWKSLRSTDLERLKKTYNVGWVVLEKEDIAGINCPYRNETIAVCQLRE